MLKHKDILKMPYGSPEQIAAADLWYEKFMRIEERSPSLISHKTWDKIHNNDVFYMARQRYVNKYFYKSLS